MTIIRQNVDNVQFDYFSGLSTAYSMSRSLKTIHSATGDVRPTNVFVDFYGYSPKTEPVTTVATHLTQLQNEISDLSIEDRLTDYIKAIWLLMIFKDNNDMRNTVQLLLTSNTIDYTTVTSRLRDPQQLNRSTKGAANYSAYQPAKGHELSGGHKKGSRFGKHKDTRGG